MKALTELNIKINLDRALDFYHQQEINYRDQMWAGPGDACSEDNLADSVYGWALHTMYDPNLPYHMYENPHEVDYKKYTKTINCVDWGATVLDFFNKSYRGVIVVSPPGTYVQPHTDIPSKYKIHIPILTNDQCVWLLDEGEYHMPAGKAYLLDTEMLHGTINRGNSNRVHVILEMQKDQIDSFEKEGII